jgi:CO/xanthine dehydrogenase FAD-binding subunit
MSLPEAIALAAAHPSFSVLAGGTDLVVQMKSGVRDVKGIVDISSIKELKIIDEDDVSVTIGACATHAAICASDIVQRNIPLLVRACSSIGAVQIQNRGTIGGNIMNASPAGDTLPVLLACDAELVVADVRGNARAIPATEFFTGYRQTAKHTGELLTNIRFKKYDLRGERSEFYKVGTRRAQAISKVVMCVRGRFDHGATKEIAIAIGSVAPVPIRALGTEALIRGKVISSGLVEQAKNSMMDEIHPIDDVRSTAMYRKAVCANLIARFLSNSRS